MAFGYLDLLGQGIVLLVFPLLQAIQAAAASFLVALASTAAPIPASAEVPASAEAALPDIAPMQQAAQGREIAASPVDRVSYSNLLQLVDEPGPHVVSVATESMERLAPCKMLYQLAWQNSSAKEHDLKTYFMRFSAEEGQVDRVDFYDKGRTGVVSVAGRQQQLVAELPPGTGLINKLLAKQRLAVRATNGLNPGPKTTVICSKGDIRARAPQTSVEKWGLTKIPCQLGYSECWPQLKSLEWHSGVGYFTLSQSTMLFFPRPLATTCCQLNLCLL